jgi:hypothetical protein
MTLDEAIGLLQGLTALQIRAFVRSRLTACEAEQYDALAHGVSYEVLVLVSARALVLHREHSGDTESNYPSSRTPLPEASSRAEPRRCCRTH